MNEYMKTLNAFGATCLIYHDEQLIETSKEKGVKPLLDYYLNHDQYNLPLIIVDKIMGKGVICLAIKIGAKEVVTPIISNQALELANKYQLKVQYEKIVPHIINRNGNGQCPVEKSLLKCDDIDEGITIIIETINSLMANSNIQGAIT